MAQATDLNNLIKAAGEGIDAAIDLVTTIATEFLNVAQIVLLAKKAEFLGALKKWFQQTNGILKLFIIFIVAGVVITGVAAIESVILSGGTIAGLLSLTTAMSDVGKLTVYWNGLKALWSIIVVLDERFEKLEQAWRNILTTIDDIIGTPLNFISSIAAAYHAYVTALYAMVGLPATDSRITFIANVSKWVTDLTTNIISYATQPGKIIDLLLGYALKADPESASEVAYASLSSVNDALTRIGALNTNVQAVIRSFDKFRSAFPEEIRAEAEAQTAIIYDFVEQQILPITEELAEISNTLRPIISEMIENITNPISEDVERVWDWVDKFKALLGFDPEAAGIQKQYLTEVMNTGILPSYLDRQTTEWIVQAAIQWERNQKPIAVDVAGSIGTVQGVTRLPPIVVADINDWLVPVSDAFVSGKPSWAPMEN